VQLFGPLCTCIHISIPPRIRSYLRKRWQHISVVVSHVKWMSCKPISEGLQSTNLESEYLHVVSRCRTKETTPYQTIENAAHSWCSSQVDLERGWSLLSFFAQQTTSAVCEVAAWHRRIVMSRHDSSCIVPRSYVESCWSQSCDLQWSILKRLELHARVRSCNDCHRYGDNTGRIKGTMVEWLHILSVFIMLHYRYTLVIYNVYCLISVGLMSDV